ncbi:MAG: hypothetical protein J0H91_12640, partial [Rhodospirillales bacterium]|nr:hypothetical protein [Rhodospirillales bacterium]
PLDDEPQLPMPGLPPAAPPAAPPRPARAAPRAGEPADGARAEAERLRAVLAATLRELEALRALLP